MRSWMLLLCVAGCAPQGARDPGHLDCVDLPSEHPRADALQRALDEARRDLELPSLALAVGDAHGVWSGAAGTADAELGIARRPCQRQPIFSVTKSYFAALVLGLVEEGEVGLDDRLADHVDASLLDGIANASSATLRQLLSMRSGIPNYVGTSFVLESLDAPARRFTRAEVLDRVRGARAMFPPGEDFGYSNTNTMLLAHVVEAKTGTDEASAMRERIFEPLGLAATTYAPDAFDTAGLVRGYFDPYGTDAFVDSTDTVALATVAADGGIMAHAADVVSFLDALLISRTVLPEPLLDEALRFGPTLEDPQWAAGLPDFDGYGLGLIRWQVAGTEGFGHGGDGFGYQAHAYAFPAEGVVFVLLANASSLVATGGNASARVDQARDRLVQVVLEGAVGR